MIRTGERPFCAAPAWTVSSPASRADMSGSEIAAARSSPQGTSMFEMLEPRMVSASTCSSRNAGQAAVVVPALVHWKAGPSRP